VIGHPNNDMGERIIYVYFFGCVNLMSCKRMQCTFFLQNTYDFLFIHCQRHVTSTTFMENLDLFLNFMFAYVLSGMITFDSIELTQYIYIYVYVICHSRVIINDFKNMYFS